jgi:hypothetical protein
VRKERGEEIIITPQTILRRYAIIITRERDDSDDV